MNFLSSTVFTLLVLCSMAYARPRREHYKRSEDENPPQLIQYESTDTDSGHKFSYDTDDGQSRDEELTILNKDTDEEEIVIKGSYSYTGTDGLIYRVDYTADRNGYHANVHKPVAHQSEANVNKPVAYQSEAIVSPAVAVAQTPAQDASS